MKHNLYTKIFKRLRGYFISPHGNLWKHLRNRLFNKNFPGNASQLKDFIQEPPPELFAQVLETQEQSGSKFSGLRDLEQEPGELLFDNILSIIKKENKPQPAILLSIPFHKKMIAAAALLLVLLSCFFILELTDRNNSQHPHLVDHSSMPALKDSLVQDDSLPAIEKGSKFLAGNHAGHSTGKKYFNAYNYLSFSNVRIGNTSIPVENNDLLFSLAKYSYGYDQPIPWNKDKGTTVRINSYSSINISPYMSSVISDLYKVKRNGKATAKARRAKQKINRWRKTDQKRFDKRKIKNPLDIIDLGENVF